MGDLHKNLGWKEDGLQEELNYSVSLSYNDLSPELKQCFLYYHFCQRVQVFASIVLLACGLVKDLFNMMVGRGQTYHHVEQIGAGDDYHWELVARNLLEPDDSNENIWEYTLHDVVRSFAQFMAKEEALVVHKDEGDIRNLLSENQKFHHLCIFHPKLELSILEKQETLRTLLIGCNIKLTW